MKIKTKTTLSFSIILLTSLIVIGFMMEIISIRILNDEISEHLKTTVSSRMAHVNTYLEMLKGRMVDFSSDGKIKDCFIDIENKIENGCSSEELSIHLIDNKLPAIKGLYEVFALDINGSLVGTTNKKEEIRKSFSNELFFIEGKKDTFIQEVYFDEEFDKLGMVVVAPVHSQTGNRDLIGVIAGRIGVEGLYNILTEKNGLGETGEIYLINKDKYIITPTKLGVDFILKQKIDTEIIEHCFLEHGTEKHLKPTTYKNYNQISVLSSHIYNSEMDWCLISEINEKEALAPVNEIIISYFFLVFILFIIFLLLSLYLLNKITLPIKKLQQGVKIIKEGNLDYKVATKNKDEIGELSRVFDEMVSNVKESRINIDKKVKLQTLDIFKKREELENIQKSILNVLEDVEEEKQKTILEKEKIDTVLRSIGDGVFVLDKDKKITIFNEAAEIISGFKEKDIIGKRYNEVLKFIREKDRIPNFDFIEKSFSSSEVQSMKDKVILIKKDGTDVPVSDSAAPIKDKEGNIIGSIIVFKDASFERKIEQMKSDFVSIASHQLRTPLTGIQWVSERLLKKSTTLPDKEKQYINDINISAKRLSRLVDDLLNVSRLESGRIAIKPQEIDLINFINSYLSETRSLTEKKNIELNFDEHPETLEIFNDQSALRNIIQSLVSNAIEYTPQGGKINVFVEKLENKFLFKVSDTGIGIPPKNQATIFDKFTRGENAQEVKTDGTGFGLYITQQTVNLLGGKIRFESILDKGTTFFVELPIKAKAVDGGKSFV